jgi:hypothetical protein
MRLTLLVCALTCVLSAQDRLSFSAATILVADNASPRVRLAARMLSEEAGKRAGVRWSIGGPNTPGPKIELALGKVLGQESFENSVRGTDLRLTGEDERGVFYAVGHLLRHLEMSRGTVQLAANYAVRTAPQTRLRGHQLGYRPKPNSYDGWDIPQWEQYIRDLIVFGTNAIELLPPRTDDDPDSPHFPRPQMEMMIAMAKIVDDYGLDLWVWYPAMDDDYSKPETVQFALREWADVLRKLPRLDAVLVPAGDPGHTPAPILLPFLEKMTANLRSVHPGVQMWLAPQGFDAKSIDFFFERMAARPAWLTGITYGPQTRISLSELRRRLPREIPIRHYPDITHTRQAQYPVPDWDVAWGVTNSREPINPRPVDQAKIFAAQQRHTIGFITYSEGCNDDVNKILWSALGWNEQTDPHETLREYGRYFIGPSMAHAFGELLFSLEANWRGPAITNHWVPQTLQQAQALERAASPAQLRNWRFQQALYRAYYDATVQARLVAETAQEQRAMELLREGHYEQAASTLSDSPPVANEWRRRVYQLAEALFQSIHMQLAVERYQGQAGRGNTLDSFEVPLNSRVWLLERIADIRKLPSASERKAAALRLASRTHPGPGGYYDDLGNTARQPHLLPGEGFDADPQFFRGPVNYFNPGQRGPKEWWDQAITFFEQPLRLRYPHLDRTARYRVRVVYGAGPLQLKANGVEIHGFIDQPFQELEFDLPANATKGGEVTLEWTRTRGGGGAGRGCQVAEVWLLRVP